MHEESAPHSKTIRAIFLGAILFMSFATALSFLGIYKSSEASPVLVAVTGILAFAYCSFFNMRFRITSEGVEAVMTPFIYRVPFGEITEVRVIEKIPWYIGWGMRIWGRRLFFVSIHKPAVEIKKKEGVFRTLVLTTSDPEKFIKKYKTLYAIAKFTKTAEKNQKN